MHDRNRRPHYQRARSLLPTPGNAFSSKIKSQPQSNQRNHHRENYRQGYERRRVVAHGRQSHRSHTNIVHARYTTPHEEAAHDGVKEPHPFSAYDK
jgi:hypothetical protein